MSDLGAIFHVKKDGTQYDAHAYTTLDECPEPNLKIKFNGSPAYIKLEAKGSGDVPCYVKKSDGSVYQIKKEAVAPTGSITINGSGTFTVPSGVHVIQIRHPDLGIVYVGVTPNTKHTIYSNWDMLRPSHYRAYVSCSSHNLIYLQDSITTEDDYQEPSTVCYVHWSPEINKKNPTITDYN